MSEEFLIYMVIGLGGLLMGVVAGFKLGYSYAMRVTNGFSLTDWVKSLIPFKVM